MDDDIFFISDHESDVTQIYSLNLKSRELRRLLNTPYDQYSPVMYPNKDLYFRTNIDGNFVVTKVAGDKLVYVTPEKGVAYDYCFDGPFKAIVFASERHITSIYQAHHYIDSLQDLIFTQDFGEGHEAVEIRNEEGHRHLLYQPKAPPKRWVVWLHGGPHEQMSPRRHSYLNALLELNYAVLAMNYPGSTGLGNKYELRGMPPDEQVRLQLSLITRDLQDFARHFGVDKYAVVGVSYGSILAHLLAIQNPGRITHVVDFSGIAGSQHLDPISESNSRLPAALFIAGTNDPITEDRSRLELMERYQRNPKTSHLRLDNEGHIIKHKSSIKRIIREIDAFLGSTK